MLKAELIGNLGADAEVKESNGSKFVTMRVAHSRRWKTEGGEDREQTIWIDVTMNDPESKVLPFLKAGVKVFVRGSMSLRVYSSQKDRCMKAGVTIAAYEVELCGGSGDEVPKQLIIPQSGVIVDVDKMYFANVDTSKWKKDDLGELVDQKGRSYQLHKGGRVLPATNQNEDAHE